MEANGWTVSLLEVGILPLEAADLAPEGFLSVDIVETGAASSCSI